MIHGGTKRIQGTGDIILPAPQMPQCHIVVCMPTKGVSTPQAYANYDEMGVKTLVENEKLLKAMEENNLAEMAKYMANDLEKAAGSDETEPIKKLLLDLGAIGSMMTGSGAAVFGIFDEEEKAEKAAKAIRDRETAAKYNIRSVFLAKPVNFGAKVSNR